MKKDSSTHLNSGENVCLQCNENPNFDIFYLEKNIINVKKLKLKMWKA